MKIILIIHLFFFVVAMIIGIIYCKRHTLKYPKAKWYSHLYLLVIISLVCPYFSIFKSIQSLRYLYEQK